MFPTRAFLATFLGGLAVFAATAAKAGPVSTTDPNASFQLVDICTQKVEIIGGKTIMEDPCYNVVITRGGGTINVWFERKAGDSISFIIDPEAPPETDGDTRVLGTELRVGGELVGEFDSGSCRLSPSRSGGQILVCGTVASSTKDQTRIYVGGSAVVPASFRLR